MDATITWNATCPRSDPASDAEILSKSLYDTFLLQMDESVQSVDVYEICGEVVDASPHPPPARRMQSSGSEIKFLTIVTTKCTGCENDMYQDADEALDLMVSDGSLDSSIQSNSNGTIDGSVTGVVDTSYTPMTNPPSKAPTKKPTAVPTNQPTQGAKSTKSAKNAKASGAPSTMKPVASKSTKSDKAKKF